MGGIGGGRGRISTRCRSPARHQNLFGDGVPVGRDHSLMPACLVVSGEDQHVFVADDVPPRVVERLVAVLQGTHTCPATRPPPRASTHSCSYTVSYTGGTHTQPGPGGPGGGRMIGIRTATVVHSPRASMIATAMPAKLTCFAFNTIAAPPIAPPCIRQSVPDLDILPNHYTIVLDVQAGVWFVAFLVMAHTARLTATAGRLFAVQRAAGHAELIGSAASEGGRRVHPAVERR